MRRIVALVAALALTVPLAACGPRDRTSPTGQQPQTTTASTQPADPAAAEDDLDQIDTLLGGVDDAFAEVDAAPTDAD